MNHGDFITITPDGIKISQQEISPLGIVDNSICWSKWLPDRHTENHKKLDHLIISPFETNAWPCLFRIRLFLNDTHGTLKSALTKLRELDFNILAIEANPSGHHHAVVNIIGESVTLRTNNDLLSFIKQISDSDRNFTNKKLSDYINKAFAPEMLTFSEKIENELYKHNITDNFLRDSFIYSMPVDNRATLYDPRKLPTRVRAIGEKQIANAVQCEWLQHHAFFWIYGLSDSSESRIFRFNTQQKKLLPDNWKREFHDRVKQLSPPFRCISKLNYHEQYFRIALSELDQVNKSHILHVPYHARYDSRVKTKGLLSDIVQSLTDGNILIRSVAMSTHAKQQNEELGAFTFLTSTPSANSTDNSEKIIYDLASDGFNVARARMESKSNCQLIPETISVSPFGTKKIFLSTNFNWLKNTRQNMIESLKTISKLSGFELIIGDSDEKQTGSSNLWNSDLTIVDNICDLLNNSDAFLQIIPAEASSHEKLMWLLYESGAAQALKLPTEVCVGTSKAVDINTWNKKLKVSAGKKLSTFHDNGSDAQLLDVFDSAIKRLSNQMIYKNHILR